MKLTKAIKFGLILILFLNLLMAFASIWVFQRMTPSIGNIIDENGKSLQACERMLDLLARQQVESNASALFSSFQDQLDIAKNNITEPEERNPLEVLDSSAVAAFSGDTGALARSLDALERLRDANWNATYRADSQAKQIGNAGAWGVCFMGVFVFGAVLIFKIQVERNLLEPFEEIASVLVARSRGEPLRRCSRYSRSADVRRVYSLLNEWIDRQNV